MAKRVIITDTATDDVKTSDSLFSFDGYNQPGTLNDEKQEPIIQVETSEPVEVPKKGRGRPKGSKNASKAPEVVDTIPADTVLTGAMLLMFCDFIVPGLFVFINNKVDKRKKLRMKDMIMDDDDRKRLEPLADAAVKQINIGVSPMQALLIGMAGTYMMKFIILKAD